MEKEAGFAGLFLEDIDQAQPFDPQLRRSSVVIKCD